MSEHSIIVEYEIAEGREAEFVALISDHARRTLEDEPGCLRFDVLKPLDGQGRPIADRVMVSEAYADAAAVEAHGKSPRLAKLRESLAALVTSRRLVLSRVIFPQNPNGGIRPENLTAANDD